MEPTRHQRQNQSFIGTSRTQEENTSPFGIIYLPHLIFAEKFTHSIDITTQASYTATVDTMLSLSPWLVAIALITEHMIRSPAAAILSFQYIHRVWECFQTCLSAQCIGYLVYHVMFRWVMRAA